VLHVEGNHLAHAETQHRDGFRGLLRQGIEIKHEDADRGVRQDHRDGALAGLQLAQRLAYGLDDRILRVDVGFRHAGHQRSGRKRRERIGRRLAPVRDGRSQNAFRREFDRAQRASGGLLF